MTILAIVVGALLSTGAAAEVHQKTTKCLPETSQRYPAEALTKSGISKKEFDEVIEKIKDTYVPLFDLMGDQFEVVREWENPEVNAYAAPPEGNKRKILLTGGLARHPRSTKDSFAMVICHEIGHHIGGAPKVPHNPWASSEGQSDYFAALKCFRKVFQGDDNEARIRNQMIPTDIANKCIENFGSSGPQGVALCKRSALAAMEISRLLAELQGQAADVESTDPNVIHKTDHGHPAAQCRFDTYLSGTVCPMSHQFEVSQSDPDPGVCVRSMGHVEGVRPFCWYNPSGLVPIIMASSQGFF